MAGAGYVYILASTSGVAHLATAEFFDDAVVRINLVNAWIAAGEVLRILGCPADHVNPREIWNADSASAGSGN